MNATYTSRLTILLAVAAMLACESKKEPTEPDPPAGNAPLAEETVDGAGGTIPIDGTAASLVVPPGALGAPTDIVVRRGATSPPEALEPSWSFEPDGTTFAMPVTFRYTFDAASLPPGTLPDDVLLVTEDNGEWVEVPGRVMRNADGSFEATALLAHFSDYAIVTVNTTSILYGVFGFAPDDVYGYGAESQIAAFDGMTVTPRDAGLGATTRLFDGYGPDPSDHYVAGWNGDGRIWNSANGLTWSAEGVPAGVGAAAGQPFVGIDGDDAAIVAVGHGGRIVINTSGTWSDASYTTPGGINNTVRRFRAVKLFGGGESWIVGDEIILAGQPGAWSELDPSALFAPNPWFVHGVWGTNPTDVTIVGWELDLAAAQNIGFIAHYDGTSWSRQTTPLPESSGWRGVWGDSTTVYVAGNNGRIVERPTSGGSWTDATLCQTTPRTLYDVWSAMPSFSAAVGGGGVFAYRDTACTGGGGPGADIVITLDTVPTVACEDVWTEAGVPIFIGPVPSGGCFFEIRAFGNPPDTGLLLASARLVFDLTNEPGTLTSTDVDFIGYCGALSIACRTYTDTTFVETRFGGFSPDILTQNCPATGAPVDSVVIYACEDFIAEVRFNY